MLLHSGRKLLPTYFYFFKLLCENLPILIPMPIRYYFELISFTDTDSYPPQGSLPKITDL